MTDLNIEALSLKELRSVKRQVDHAIMTLEGRKRAAALAAVKDMAMRHGYELAELTGRKVRQKRRQKYANPDDPDQTWSGVGRKPHWFREALENGVAPCDIEIQPA